VDVVITDEGLTILKKMDSLNEEMDGIIRGLSEQEAKYLNDLLDKMRDAHSVN
jgi:hypothetical protein